MKTEYEQAKIYAIRRLAMQSMLTASLEEALERRQIVEDTIKSVIAEVTALGYLDDRAWLASFVRVQTGRKQGPRTIASKLAAKGVSQEEIQEALEAVNDDEQQLGLLQQLLSSSRYKKFDLSDFHSKQKVIASLMRRGFTYSSISNALNLKTSIEYDQEF